MVRRGMQLALDARLHLGVGRRAGDDFLEQVKLFEQSDGLLQEPVSVATITNGSHLRSEEARGYAC